MAVSKTYTFGQSVVNSTNPYCKLVVKETATSTANNTSTLSVVLTLYRPSSVSSSASKDYSVTVAGTTWSGTTTIGGSGSKTIISKTLTVSHDSDGSKTIKVKASMELAITWSGTYIGTISLSSTSLSLTTIARASSITSASAVTMGNACAVKWTPNASSFKFKIKFSCGGKTYTTGYISPSTTSAYTYKSYTFKTSTWAPYITSAKSATCTTTLYTYTSDGTSVGSATKTFTLSVPSSLKPSLSLSVEDAEDYYSSYGGYITSLSKLACTVTNSTELYGATIKYKFTANNTSSSVSGISGTAGTSYTYTSGTLTSSSYNTVTVSATDSRGYTASITSDTLTIYEYSKPIITSFTAGRTQADSTIVSASLVSATFSDLNGQNEIVSAELAYKLTSSSSYSDSNTASMTVVNNGDGTVSGTYADWESGTFEEDATYNLKLTLTDTIGSSVSAVVKISTILVLLDFPAGGLGLGIGKAAEGNYLDIGLDAYVYGVKLVYTAGDTMELSSWHSAGYISSSSTTVYFNVPLCKPSAAASVECSSMELRVRQNGSYIIGDSSSYETVTPTTLILRDGYITVMYNAGSALDGATNNDACGIQLLDTTFTFVDDDEEE